MRRCRLIFSRHPAEHSFTLQTFFVSNFNNHSCKITANNYSAQLVIPRTIFPSVHIVGQRYNTEKQELGLNTDLQEAAHLAYSYKPFKQHKNPVDHSFKQKCQLSSFPKLLRTKLNTA